MTIITQGNSSTGTLNYLDSVTVEAGSGFASFESPSGTVLAQFSGARTFGPYSNRTYRVVAILGDIKYSINDDFPQGSVVQSVPVMGPSGTITGLRNPDGTVTSLTGGSTAFTALTDAVTAPIATTNTSVATAIAAVVANDLTTSATIAPSKDAVNAALALKASILNPVDLGTGAIALTAASHANHSCSWSGTTNQTITIDPTGGAVGDVYEVDHVGAGGILTFPGSAAPGYTLSFGPGVVGQVVWRGGTTYLSLIPNASNAPISVSGSTVNGSVLTRTLASGWTETGGNWTRDGTNISGATSSTYTTVSADGGHTVTWKSSTIPFIPTGIAVAVSTSAPVFTAQSAPAGTVGSAYSYTFVATGATSYAVASGTVPAGLTLNTGTGVLSGTPTSIAAYTFVISATNVGGTTNSTSQSVTISSSHTDSFDRADNASITVGAPITWANVSGATGIVSNEAKGLGFYVYNSGNSLPTVGGGLKTNLADFSLLYFMGDGTGSNYMGVGVKTDGAVNLFIKVGGTFNSVATSATGLCSSGVSADIQVICTANGGAPSNTDFVVKVNGSTALTFSNLTVTRGNYCGFALNNGTDTLAYFDAA